MILVYSIPHTGTHFTDNLLTRNGCPPDGSVHITDTLEDVSGFDTIIVPLRHPEKVAQSWAKRYELRGAQLWKQWMPAWDLLIVLERNPRVFFFDLERQSVKGLSVFLGQDIHTDWAPLNHIDLDAKPIIPEYEISQAVVIYERVARRKATAA